MVKKVKNRLKIKDMKIKLNLSPNFSKKPRLKKDIKFVIIHYTGMQSEIESLKDLKAVNTRSAVII